MWSSCRSSPESCDSIGNGTITRSGSRCPNTGCCPAFAPANSHGPLRLSHLSRSSCGRGYSGNGLRVSTFSPHGVRSRCFDEFATVRAVLPTFLPSTANEPAPS